MIENLLSNLQNYIEAGSLVSFAIVFLGGMLVSFTPCVYPVLPITVAYIGAASAGSKIKGFSLSVSYVIGMAFIYSALGAIAALTGSLFGSIQNSPWVFILVGAACVLMGFSMFDMFTIRLPGFLSGIRLTATRKGFLGAFMVGMVSGLVIGPCTAPVLAVLLAYVASKQNIILGMSLMFTFALGMGVLLIAVGTFAGLLTNLPKSGRWMVVIKKFFGLVLIAIGGYFLKQIMQ